MPLEAVSPLIYISGLKSGFAALRVALQGMQRVFFLLTIMFFAVTTQAQTSEEYLQPLRRQTRIADSLLNHGQCFDAVTEYERLMFFDTLNALTAYALKQQGFAFRCGGKYEDAAISFGKALVYTHDTTTMIQLKIELIRVLLLQRRFSSAYNIIQELANDSRAGDKKYLNYWRGWTWLLQDEWQTAAEYFAKCDTAVFLKNFCLDVHNKKYPVSFVKLISVFVPGSGAIYTGRVFQGLVSLGWNVLFGYTTVTAFLEQRALDGFLVGSLLWLRFYTGNLEISERYAVEDNLLMTNNALKYLAIEFQGVKP